MNKALLAGLLFMVTVAVLGGLWAVGGPGQARLLKQDGQRLEDLSVLQRYLICRSNARNDQPLPQRLDDPAYCTTFVSSRRDGALPLTDPVSGVPYAYRRIDDRNFEVCATLATTPQDRKGSRLNARPLKVEAGNVTCLRGDSRYDG